MGILNKSSYNLTMWLLLNYDFQMELMHKKYFLHTVSIIREFVLLPEN